MAWFNFLDKNCNDYGIVVEKYPSLFIPVKSFEKVNIAGNDKAEYREGTYEPITLSIECYLKDRSPQKIREISKWLNSKSEGKLILGNDPNFYYNARIINAIPINKVINLFGRFVIQFECEPFVYSLEEEVITITTNTEIENKGITVSKPIYKLYGNGEAKIKVNDKEVTLYGVGNYIEIDTELMECYKDNTSLNTSMNGNYTSLWLNEGINNIEFTGASKIEITPNWRY